MAVSRLGVSSLCFYQMTPVEVMEAFKDHALGERDRLKVTLENQWEQTRTTLFHLYCMNPHIKRKPKLATDVFRLPWDKDTVVKTQTVEEISNTLLRIHKMFSPANTSSKGKYPNSVNTEPQSASE